MIPANYVELLPGGVSKLGGKLGVWDKRGTPRSTWEPLLIGKPSGTFVVRTSTDEGAIGVVTSAVLEYYIAIYYIKLCTIIFNPRNIDFN